MLVGSRLLSWRGVVALVTGAAFLFACTAETTAGKKKKRSPVDPGDEFYDDETPLEEVPIEPSINEDSGAFGAGQRPKEKDGGGNPIFDGGVVDGGKTYCTGALAVGDLAVVEIMVTSRAGSGDDGEWVEIRNTKDCWLKLDGVTVESPRGAIAPNVATAPAGLELAPGAAFVVADSTDPAKNHNLKGIVLAWNATDVLKNDGDTVIVKAGATVIDQVTYPAFNNLSPGRAISFPSDCAANLRSDWTRWSLTFDEFSPGFKGTPAAANNDVTCF